MYPLMFHATIESTLSELSRINSKHFEVRKKNFSRFLKYLISIIYYYFLLYILYIIFSVLSCFWDIKSLTVLIKFCLFLNKKKKILRLFVFPFELTKKQKQKRNKVRFLLPSVSTLCRVFFVIFLFGYKIWHYNLVQTMVKWKWNTLKLH